MYSATWPKEVRALAEEFLNSPVHMTIGSSELTTNSAIKQIVYQVDEYEKLSKLLDVLDQYKDAKTIVFVMKKTTADQLADKLYDKGMAVMSLHGDKSQAQRDHVLIHYKNAKKGILVATDVAARGLDVSDINLVINYDFPGDIESYVHRIGRTARGTSTGVAVTFFTPENNNMSRKLYKIMRQANQEIPEWLDKIANATPRGAHRQQYGRGYGRGYDDRGYGRGYGSRGPPRFVDKYAQRFERQ